MIIFKQLYKFFVFFFIAPFALLAAPFRLIEVALTQPSAPGHVAGFKEWFKKNNVGVTIGNVGRALVSAAGAAVPGGGAIADIINNTLLKPKPQEMAVIEAQVAVGKGIESPQQAVQKRDLPATGLKLSKLDGSQTNIGKPQDGSGLNKNAKDTNLPWYKKMWGWMFPAGQKVYKMPGVYILIGIGVLVYFGWFSKRPWFKKKRSMGRRW